MKESCEFEVSYHHAQGINTPTVRPAATGQEIQKYLLPDHQTTQT